MFIIGSKKKCSLKNVLYTPKAQERDMELVSSYVWGAVCVKTIFLRVLTFCSLVSLTYEADIYKYRLQLAGRLEADIYKYRLQLFSSLGRSRYL